MSVNGLGAIVNPYFEASRDLPSCLDRPTAEPGINHSALAAKFCILAMESLLCLAIVCAMLLPSHVIKRQGHTWPS